MTSEQIYVAIVDEGTNAWRPVPAWKVSDSTYIILRPDWYDPDDERWQFPPGSTVVCETRKTDDGLVLAAVRQAQVDRQTA